MQFPRLLLIVVLALSLHTISLWSGGFVLLMYDVCVGLASQPYLVILLEFALALPLYALRKCLYTMCTVRGHILAPLTAFLAPYIVEAIAESLNNSAPLPHLNPGTCNRHSLEASPARERLHSQASTLEERRYRDYNHSSRYLSFAGLASYYAMCR